VTALTIPFISGDIIEGRNVTHTWTGGFTESWERLEVMYVDQVKSRMYVKHKIGTQHFTWWCDFVADNFRSAKNERPLNLDQTMSGVG
jgi:hypothetical protein